MRAFLLAAASLLLASAFGAPAAVDRRCQVYLCKYGYTEAFDCVCPPDVSRAPCLASSSALSSPDRRRSAPECTGADFERALAAFQAAYLQTVTNVCDGATLAAMKAVRCGEADDFPNDRFAAAAAAERREPAPEAAGGGDAPATTTPFRAQLATPAARRGVGLPLREAAGRFERTGAAAPAAAISPDAGPRLSAAAAAPASTAAATARATPAGKSAQAASTRRRRRGAAAVPGAPAEAAAAAAVWDAHAATSAQAAEATTGRAAPAHRRASLPLHLREADGRPSRLHRAPTSGHGGRSAAALPSVAQPPLRDDAAAADAPRDRNGAAERARLRRTATLVTTNATFGSKRALRWRIIPGYYYPQLSVADQEAALALALRKWAAVTPLCFVQDVQSNVNAIDILVAFATGQHLGDGRPFSGPGGEIAHTYPTQFSHFDAAQSWYVGPAGTATGFQLTAAAIHEFGHAIGLKNSQSKNDVMYSMYSGKTSLSEADRTAAKALYGRCSGSINAIVDIVYTMSGFDPDGNPTTSLLYSTVIFRGASNWLYLNSDAMPLDGEPQPIRATWSGIPNSVDAVVQYIGDQGDGTFVYTVLIFKGSSYYIFDYVAGVVTYSGSIGNTFKAGPSGQPIPNNIDSAYFDPRDKNMYFFKASKVYAYRYDSRGNHSCCVYVKNISEVFPPAPNQATPAVAVTSYQQKIDAVYFQQSSSTLYFFVDDVVWISKAANSSSASANASVANGSSTAGDQNSKPGSVSSPTASNANPTSGSGNANVSKGSSATVNLNLNSSVFSQDSRSVNRSASASSSSSSSAPVGVSTSSGSTNSAVLNLSSTVANDGATVASDGSASTPSGISATTTNGSLAAGSRVTNEISNYTGDQESPGSTSATASYAYSTVATGASSPTIAAVTSTVAVTAPPATSSAAAATAPPATSAATAPPTTSAATAPPATSSATAPPTTSAATAPPATSTATAPSATSAAAATSPTTTSTASATTPSSTNTSRFGIVGNGANLVYYYGYWSDHWRYVCQMDC